MTKKRVVAEKLSKSEASKSLVDKSAERVVEPSKPLVKAAKGTESKGRPSLYTKEIALEICTRLADGESLNAICKDEHLPSNATVRSWALDNVEGFSAHYTRARELGYSLLAEEMMAIADTPVIGSKTTSKATGIETTEGDMIEHRRLQVDTRKWMLSKMLPKIYGDKLSLEADINVTQLTPEQRADKIAQLQAKLQKTAPT